MSELSIENTHKLLLEDRSAINTSTVSSLERTQLLMQNTNAIKELLQLKLFDDSQLKEHEQLACESIEEEFKRCNKAGVLPAEQLINMGSSKSELSVSADKSTFKIVIEQTS